MPQAKLKYGVEFTRNLGNFQNVKPSFSVEIDAAFTDLADLDAIKDSLAETVDGWLIAKVEELDEELNK